MDISKLTSTLENNWGKIAGITTAGAALYWLFREGPQSDSGVESYSGSGLSKLGHVKVYPNKELFMRENGPFASLVAACRVLVKEDDQKQTVFNKDVKDRAILRAIKAYFKNVESGIVPKEVRNLDGEMRDLVDVLTEARIPGVQKLELKAKTKAQKTFATPENLSQECTNWSKNQSDNWSFYSETNALFKALRLEKNGKLHTVGGVYKQLKGLLPLEAHLPTFAKLKEKNDKLKLPPSLQELFNKNGKALLKPFKALKTKEQGLELEMNDKLKSRALKLIEKILEAHKALSPKEEEKKD